MQISHKFRFDYSKRTSAGGLSRDDVTPASHAVGVLQPFTMVAGLEALCLALGRSGARGDLTGAMPTMDGDMAPSFVPDAGGPAGNP